MSAQELCFLPATELAARIRSRQVSCEEVMRAHIAQVERVNPKVNAIVTFLPEQALEAARSADVKLAHDSAPTPQAAPLYGLPVAHKDLAVTKGIRTTFGSPIFRDFVPDADAVIVERLNAAGAITIGKTNTPELGAGSQTFNPVFGRNAQPLRPDEDLRRQQWRCGRRACLRNGADRRRQRLRGQPAQSGQLLQHHRLSPFRRACAGVARAERLVSAARRRSDGADRARHRAPAHGDRRARPAIAASRSLNRDRSSRGRSSATSRMSAWRGAATWVDCLSIHA